MQRAVPPPTVHLMLTSEIVVLRFAARAKVLLTASRRLETQSFF
jgi:hypothetical protein